MFFASGLRALADRLDPVATAAQPAYNDVVGAQLQAARFALLDAEAELERWKNTVAMLATRVERLQLTLAPAEGPTSVNDRRNHVIHHPVASLPSSLNARTA